MTLLLLTLPFFAVGFATGRFAAAAATPVVVASWYAGVAAGWWGNGLGDGWQAACLITASVATLQTVVGVSLRRLHEHFGRAPRVRSR